MAGPISHIVCALSILASGLLDVQDHRAFIVGTSFPDIRYLGVVAREKTHVKNITWYDVKNEKDPFVQGVLLHSLVDRVREEYFYAHGIYDDIPTFRFRSHLMKFYEDMTVYEQVNDWLTISTYFNSFYQQESAFGIRQLDLFDWHNILQQFVVKKPTLQRISTLLLRYPLKKYVPRWLHKSMLPYLVFAVQNLFIRKVAGNKKYNAVLKEFYQNAAAILSSEEYNSNTVIRDKSNESFASRSYCLRGEALA